MFTPIGQGDIDFAAIVKLLDDAGFDGYWVLEQDIMLDEDPGRRRSVENAKASFAALAALA